MGWDFPQDRGLGGAKQWAKKYIHSHPILRFCWIKLAQIRFQIFLFIDRTCDWGFDVWNGIDSRGQQELEGLTLKGSHKLEATAYAPVDRKCVRHGLSSLEIDFSKYVFVDLGCGKGRAVLLASGYPFKKIIGVEFAKELYEIALENARSWRPKRKCGPIEFVWADILEFEIPDDCCVLYFYHPFSEIVLSRLLENVLRSLEACQRDIFIVYVNPVHQQAIQSLPNVEWISK